MIRSEMSKGCKHFREQGECAVARCKRRARNLLTPGQVADLFNVDPRTVNRWARDGLLNAVRTPGNHWRFSKDDVAELLGVPVEDLEEAD